MCKIKRLTVSGFRGIPNQLDLVLNQNGTPRSAVIYGENGTGKSSLVDSWEWFRKKKIEHLAREGAQEQSYPHLLARADAIFTEVEFAHPALNTLRLTFDRQRVTQPAETGDFQVFRELVQAPCHLRFGDLTRFVYFTKTERFDALASLMGFVPQVEYQKALRRVENRLDTELLKNQAIIDDLQKDLATTAGVDTITETTVMTVITEKLSKIGVDCPPAHDAIQLKLQEISDRIASDPVAKRLSGLKGVKESFARQVLSKVSVNDLKEYQKSLIPFKERSEDIANLLLLDLYRAGEAAITQTGKVDFCPLCQRDYDGNLLEHIKEHALALADLKEVLEDLEAKKAGIAKALTSTQKLQSYLADMIRGNAWANADLDETILPTNTDSVDKSIAVISSYAAAPLAEVDTVLIGQLGAAIDTLEAEITVWTDRRAEAAKTIDQAIAQLEADTSRKSLVDTHSAAKRLLDAWTSLTTKLQAMENLSKTKASYVNLVEEYVTESSSDVNERFQRISSKVETYFDILESQTPGISSPSLKLLTDQDRSVILEVGFHGQSISPAYKYLSESQLNSFGLAVFLASAREFNPGFKLLILDDVINSFDAYKRPQVIRLLQTHFDDCQILVLTHDQIWRDQLYRVFPNWLKREFYSFAYRVGPCIREGLATADRIRQLCEEDHADEAGASLGRYLELRLQELCECFEAMVKFRRKNDATLDTLLDRFRLRVREKLSPNHSLAVLLEQIWNDAVFRNFCAHWKELATPYTRQEIEGILNHWLSIEAQVYCRQPRCMEALKYDSREESFLCPCGLTRLSRA